MEHSVPAPLQHDFAQNQSPMHDRQRVLSFPALLNARDLGGHPTLDSSSTRWRSLVRSDDPVQLTAAGLDALAQYGIATVIDLRWAEEIAISPNPIARELRHIDYHHIPLLAETSEQWHAVSGERVSTKEAWKCLVLTHSRPQLRRVLQVIAAAPSGPLLFHCVAGKDRTGVVAALLLALADVLPEAIAADYAASTEQLREAYLVRHADQDPAELLEALRCPPQGVHRMLTYLGALGGVRGYLQAIGLSDQEVAQLRARLRN
jgi:protein-tyrosine phosphatase